MMTSASSVFLVAAGLTFAAAVGHFACIFWGAEGFRFFGAGARLVKLAERGHWYPSVIAFAVGAMLVAWSAYALSGAGILPILPFAKVVLVLITSAFLIRSAIFPVLKSRFPGNSQAFWINSSAICLVIGIAYLVGLVGRWGSL